MFLLLLTMEGSQADKTDWENMTNKELHDKFWQMMSGQVEDVLNRFEETMEKIDGIEKALETKLDNKFNELLACFPQPPPAETVAPLQQEQQQQKQNRLPNQVGRAQRVPLEPGQTFGAGVPTVDASVAPAATVEVEDITRMGLIKIRTTCNHQHHHHEVVLMHIITTVGLHHHLRYEIMTIFLN